MFANNPVTGLLMVAGLLQASPAVAVSAVVAALAALAMARYCGQPQLQVQVISC